ncbi:MAG: hypothetical protein JW821_10900 [Deltaproteobacteria bacterium]|nr:hypothetical protein [Deltaproteobacteria bacterium]
MDVVDLMFSHLCFRIDLAGLSSRVCRDVARAFSPFAVQNGRRPRETLAIKAFRIPWGKRIASELGSTLREILQVPSGKFPFPSDPEREIEGILDFLRPFCRHREFPPFFSDLKNPAEAVIYPLNRGCLVRRQGPAGSVLFLKRGFSRRQEVEAVCRATHLSVSMALPLVEGIMLHGVGVRREGVGFLFLGLSGSGKTTLSRFSPPEEVISDDGIIVERAESGFALAPGPIDQSHSEGACPDGCGPGKTGLCMGFLLEKDRKVSLERLHPSDACSIILKNHIHYFRHFPSASVERSFRLVSDLCRRIPFYRLYFRKEPSFWELIAAEMKNGVQHRGEGHGFERQ